ncbi:MAG: type II toxin-antitoxin system VapC family toxin [Candidatus Altiarchaeota archaeon]|nr:type II toxin-antitoxin system VapC family toxin [Candidatus Altiarchaeota archaeon]
MKFSVFIDTNVFIFSFEYPESNSRKIIDLLNEGEIEAIVCDTVVKEVIKYFERHHNLDLARLFRRYLVGSCTIIPGYEVIDEMGKLRDKIKRKDLEQISTVKKYGLKYLVACDRDFKDFEEYVTPKEFIDILGLKAYDVDY